MCLRRHCPARASPAQSFSISELQAERTFPLLPHEATQIDATTIIEASNPLLLNMFKSRLDISATPKVVVITSDGLVGCGGGTSSLLDCRLARVSRLVESSEPQSSCDVTLQAGCGKATLSEVRPADNPLGCQTLQGMPINPAWHTCHTMCRLAARAG